MNVPIPNLTESMTQLAVDAALEAAQDWANAELQRLREELAPDPALANLFNTLRRLLPGTNADGSPLSDADILARAVDEIITLRADADRAAWRDVATAPPPLRCDVLFANDDEIWVGQALSIDARDPDALAGETEIVYLRNEEILDCHQPTAWAILPILDDTEG